MIVTSLPKHAYFFSNIVIDLVVCFSR